MGTVWGHGAYLAPDWSADWLHRESVWLLDHWAQKKFGKLCEELERPDQAALQSVLQTELRTNTHNPETGELVVSNDRGEAIRAVAGHYIQLFSDAPELAKLFVLNQQCCIGLSRQTALRSESKLTANISNWPNTPFLGSRHYIQISSARCSK